MAIINAEYIDRKYVNGKASAQGINSGMVPTVMSASERVEQLFHTLQQIHVIVDALHPEEMVKQPNSNEPMPSGIIALVDLCNRSAYELQQRVERIKELIGQV